MKEAPSNCITSIEKYKRLIEEIYKIHLEVLKDKPEIIYKIKEKIKKKENQIFIEGNTF